MADLYSPKQVARAIGVSESSLKRWCDDGLLPVVRTPGGHRRLPVQGVLAFIRKRGRKIVDPAVLGLPSTSGQGEFVIGRARGNLRDALVAGDEERSRSVLVDLYLANIPIHRICDEVVAGVFHDIGDQWACDEVEIYQERRACEIAIRCLLELRMLGSPKPEEDAPTAIGGTSSGDHYILPTTMVEMVLAERGWRARSLGTSLPFPTLVNAIETLRPQLFWLSVAHVEDARGFLKGLRSLDECARSHDTRLVLGGRGLTTSIRDAVPEATICETFSELPNAG